MPAPTQLNQLIPHAVTPPPQLAQAADALADLRSDAGSVLDEALTRGSAAWDVLRGERVGPPVAVRRWPWAVGAAVAGAGAGVGVAFLLRRLRTQDAPDAVDPDQVEAVVDRPPAGPGTPD